MVPSRAPWGYATPEAIAAAEAAGSSSSSSSFSSSSSPSSSPSSPSSFSSFVPYCNVTTLCEGRAERAEYDYGSKRCVCRQCTHMWEGEGERCESCRAPFKGERCNECMDPSQVYPGCRETGVWGTVKRVWDSRWGRLDCGATAWEANGEPRRVFYNWELGQCTAECTQGWTGNRCEYCPKPFTGRNCDECIEGDRSFPMCYATNEENFRAKRLHLFRGTAVLHPVGYGANVTE